MTDLNKAIQLAEAASEQLQKSHVKQYTRGDGTVVKEHDDARHPQIIGRATDIDTYNPKKAYEFTFNGKRYSHTGKEGKSMHDGRHVSEFEHGESGHRVWMDDGGSVHADSKEEADRHHKRGRYVDHNDSQQEAAEHEKIAAGFRKLASEHYQKGNKEGDSQARKHIQSAMYHEHEAKRSRGETDEENPNVGKDSYGNPKIGKK